MPDLLGFYPALVRKGIFKGVDLKPLVERFWRLEAMRVDGRSSAPEVRWRACRYPRGSTAYVGFKHVTLNMAAGDPIEDAVETLLHEIVHCALPLREGHSELFNRRLIACAREAFGLDLNVSALLALPAKNGCIAYAIDDAIRAAMISAGIGDKLREDPSTRFEAPPPPTELEVVAQEAVALEARKEKAHARAKAREEHAREMLARWERRSAMAKRIVSKWRAKVRYYDRKQEAAKR